MLLPPSLYGTGEREHRVALSAEMPQSYVRPSSPPPTYLEASKFPPLIREKLEAQEREIDKCVAHRKKYYVGLVFMLSP